MSRYSISELVALQDHASIDIGPDNLLRCQKTGSTTDRDPTSSGSRRDRSTATSDDSFQKLTSRPQSETHEKDSDDSSGFVNFLKRHTSPKHQRVTPGGKVVHVDTKVPAPEFKPPTLKKSDDCPPKAGKNLTKSTTSQESNSERKTAQNSNESSNSNSVKFDTSGGHDKPKREPASVHIGTVSEETNPPTGAFYPTWQSLQQMQVPLLASDIYRQQLLPLTPGLRPIFQVIQPGQEPLSTAGHFNYPSLLLPDPGTWYQTAPQSYINQGSVLQNLPQPQTGPLLATLLPTVGNQGTVPPTFSLPEPQMNAPSTYSLLGASNWASQLPQPITPYVGAIPTYVADQSSQKSLQDAIKELQSLSTQLANLDRYMAIHVFEMDTETKQGLVEQRRNLVKDLDMARRYKEHLESTLKIPSTIAGATGAAHLF